MAFNEVYKKKLDKDGNPIIDPDTNDFIMELISSEEVDEPIVNQPPIDLGALTQEQIDTLKIALSKL